MANEPSLSELSNIPSDADLGTAGLTDYVPNMRQLNQQLFEAAKFKASMDWQKYTQFLNNFKEVSKDANEIAKMDVAPNDREYLKGEMAKIFSDIEKNPKSTLGGNGMFDIQSRLQKLTSDATLSKQDNMYDKYHRRFLDRVPDLKTDDNKAKVDGFLKNQKLGQRQPYMLDQPVSDFDGDKLFAGILKNSTRPFSENFLNPNDDAGKPMQGYIKTETGEEVNPKSIQGLWGLALSSHPELRKSITKRYNELPEEMKKQYDTNGGVQKFFEDLGKSYLQAQFPEGTYEQTKAGTYRFNKKSELKADPNYLAAQKLAQQQKEHRDNMAYKWASLEKGTTEDKDTADSVLNEAISILQKGEEVDVDMGGGKTNKVLRIGDPFLLQKFGTIDKEGKTTNPPDVVEYDRDKDQVRLVYYEKTPIVSTKNDEDGTTTHTGGDIKKTASGKNIIDTDKTKTIDQRTWLKEIAKRTSPNKDLGGVNKLVDKVLSKNGNSVYKLSTTPTSANVLVFPDGSEVDIDKEKLSDKQIKKALDLGAKRKK